MTQKRIEIDMSDTPSFSTVTGLSNTTFDPTNVVAHRGASEGQVKAVHDALTDLQTWIAQNGGTSEALFTVMQNKLNETAALITNCGAEEHSNAVLDAIWTKLETLETQVAACMARPCFGSGTDGGDGNEITVSFAWNGADPFAAGGTATAASAMADHTITGFYFLCRDSTSGLYYRSETANGGDYTWTINTTTGAVTASEGATARYAHVIIAADDHGCEGMCLVNLPAGTTGTTGG